MDAVRFAAGTEDVVEGWLVPFGTKDTYGTTFTRDTDFCLDWFAQRPWLYHHGLDGEVRTDPIGVISALEVRDAGLWMQAQLTAHNEYVDAVRELVKKGALGLSSGAMAHLVAVDEASGEVQRWPLVEGSATPTPSNINATIDLHTFKSHVRATGIDLPADALARLEEGSAGSAPGAPPVSARLGVGGPGQTLAPATRADGGAQDGEDAGDDRSYEDLISDLRDVLNPASPFSAAAYTFIMATYSDHVLCCRWDGSGDGDGDEQTYWRVAYTVSADGEPTLGTATQVEQTYVPVASSRSSLGPLTLDAHQLTLHAGALAQRTQDLSDRRIREGRVLSAHNRQLLTDAHARMGEAHGALGDLLDATGRQADDAARAARWADPSHQQWQRQQVALLDLYTSTLP